jgi:hypothetical protein
MFIVHVHFPSSRLRFGRMRECTYVICVFQDVYVLHFQLSSVVRLDSAHESLTVRPTVTWTPRRFISDYKLKVSRLRNIESAIDN